MPRARSPSREKAYKLWLASGKKRLLKDIAAELGVSEEQVRKWKCQDKWEKATLLKDEKSNITKKKRGGQPGNKNAKGHGAPKRNKNAEKYGFLTKYLPEDTMDIVSTINAMDPLDILWQNISIQYAAIIRAQQIMYVNDKQDKTVEKVEEKNGKVIGERFEVQQAWDKQANFLQAQSRAMQSLNAMIRRYDDMLHKRYDLATEEQKERINKLRAEVAKIKGEDQEIEDLTETDAEIYG